jgi:hypothetical protein
LFTSRPLTSFESRWLAEVVRRHEERHGPLGDAAECLAAREVPAALEARILHRADALGAREGWRDAILRWHGRARMVLAVAAVLALVFGFGAAAGVLGDGSRAVNVVWALGGLLGVNVFSLLLWLAATALPVRGGVAPPKGGALGGVWLRVVAALDRSPAAAAVPQALAGLTGRSRIAQWGLGCVTHTLWALALTGAVSGVLALLATRRYGFVWETTILPGDLFVGLTTALGALPSWLGFPVPDPATVVASGDAPMLDEAGRRAWAGWLVGALLVYGLLPRLLLALACGGLWVAALRRLKLDLARPGYARLRATLMPDSERIGVSDPEPAVMPRPLRHAAHEGASGTAALVALELGTDLAWPPARVPAALDAGRLDSREQRRAALSRFAANVPGRLLVAIDPRRTPDRGNLGLIAELADHAAETRVWAVGGDTSRLALWRDGLTRLGFAPDALILDAAAAQRWLAGQDVPTTGEAR